MKLVGLALLFLFSLGLTLLSPAVSDAQTCGYVGSNAVQRTIVRERVIVPASAPANVLAQAYAPGSGSQVIERTTVTDTTPSVGYCNSQPSQAIVYQQQIPVQRTIVPRDTSNGYSNYGYASQQTFIQRDFVRQRSFGNAGGFDLGNLAQGAIQGGLVGQLSGGKFGKGALAGAGLAALSGGNGGFGGGQSFDTGGGFGGGGFGNLAQGAIQGAVIGKLSGGKIGKGALAGAALNFLR